MTTTTTTTTSLGYIPPLLEVITTSLTPKSTLESNPIITPQSVTSLSGEVFIVSQTSNASDSINTTKSSKSISLGTLAPGETSKTLIVTLNVPRAKSINNIKIGLIKTGGIDFSTTTFGISNSPYLSTAIEPEEYFLGVNSEGTAANQYNISIPNKNDTTSDYVYLNINVPRDATPYPSVLRFRWFFDYAD